MNRIAALAAMGLAVAACAAQPHRPRVDAFPLRFPLIEAGTLEVEGHVVGQPRAQGDIVYFTTREGYLTAVVVPSRSVLWRFRTDNSLSSSLDLAGDFVLFHDDGGAIYGVVSPGRAILKKTLDEVVTTPVRIIEGGVVLGTAEGKVLISDPGGNNAAEYKLPGPEAKITAGPVPVYDRAGWLAVMLFGRSDGRLVAIGKKGKPAWEFQAGGAIQADPVQDGGRIYFGDSDRTFYCLDAGTGKVAWRRRLQGSALHPAVIKGGTVAVAASNSVVYRLSRRGGSILSWEAIPSRIVYELGAAGPVVLVSSASPTVMGLDLRSGRRAGQYEASGPLVAGAVWSPPYVVLFAEDVKSGRERLVFLRSR